MTLAFICLVKIIFIVEKTVQILRINCVIFVVVPNSEKENAPEGPTQKGLREAREKNKDKTKIKKNTKV